MAGTTCVGKHGEPQYYCAECKNFLCFECCTSWHSNVFSTHVLMEAKFILEIEKDLAYIPTEEDFRDDDLNNLFLCFSTDADAQHGKLSFQRKYFTLDIQEDAILPVVSFIGGTGAGKSRLMRMFVKEGHQKPLPGSPYDTDSTSADVHAYLGSFAPFNALMFDSEGSNGTVPRGAKSRWSVAIDEARREAVRQIYPRLLYMFSDVVCFVTTLSKREQHSLLDQITIYGGLAAASTVNQNRLPLLILVFNKITHGEGKWTVEEASRDFNKNEELKLFFRDIKVVDIPDLLYLPQFLEQVTKLKDEISKGFQYAISNQPRTKKTLFQFLQLAVTKFNSNPESSIDFVDLLFHTLPLPDQYAGFLVAFFEHAYHCAKLVTDAHNAFYVAYRMLTTRLSYTFRHHLTRMHGPDEMKMKSLPQGLIRVLDVVESQIQQYQPCEAKHTFAGDEVVCEVLRGYHMESHQSPKTHSVSRPVFLLGWLGVRKHIKVACRWQGAFIADAAAATRLSEVVNQAMQLGQYVSMEQSRAQYLPLIGDAIYHTQSPRVCLGCLLQLPTERLLCGHLLCSLCCEEQTPTNSTIRCPLCRAKSLWDHPTLPEGAGYRILSLEAGGIRGVVTAMLLNQIETNLGIPINHLFDLVVGTGSGGLISLGIGEHKRMEDLVTLFHIMSQKAFVPVSKLGNKFAQLVLNHKYRFSPLHDTLSKHFSRRPLLGVSFPRVAVVGCVPFLNPRVCLFSSYHPAHRQYCQQLQGSVLDVAEVFGSGTFYPVLGLDSICAVDGSVACSNPSTIAAEEAANIWPEKPLEMLVSVGVGEWTTADRKLGNDKITFAWSHVSMAQLSDNDWSQLLKQIPPSVLDSGSAIRVDVTLASPFAMDNVKKIYQIVEETKAYIARKKSEIDTVSNKLLAKLFYIPKANHVVDENGFIVCIQARRQIPQLRRDNVYFSVRIFMGGKSVTVNSTCSWNGQQIKLAVEKNNIPLQGVINVLVFSHIGYDGARIDPGFVISGCPFVCHI